MCNFILNTILADPNPQVKRGPALSPAGSTLEGKHVNNSRINPDRHHDTKEKKDNWSKQRYVICCQCGGEGRACVVLLMW